MKKGKIIVIEGTDCSGKGTQTEMLLQRLKENNIPVAEFNFPYYDSPTGKIVGGPYLGKTEISKGWFPEGAANVNPLVASLYYSADRLYNLPKIKELLSQGKIVILNRYTYSNMAHQGGKFRTSKQRDEMYEKLAYLEFDFLGLPRPDFTIFLHMPFHASLRLKKIRKKELDEHERSKSHLLKAERAYIELASKYNWKTIECAINDEPRTIEDISNELYSLVEKEFNLTKK